MTWPFLQCIPYSVLLKDLEMRNLRELEDLIIEAVYTDIIQGKLDQRNQLLEVDFCIGRDIRKKDISNIVKTLHEWWGWKVAGSLSLGRGISSMPFVPLLGNCGLQVSAGAAWELGLESGAAFVTTTV